MKKIHLSPCPKNEDIKIISNETEGIASIISLNDEQFEISSSDQP
jgi:hypothetical protein